MTPHRRKTSLPFLQATPLCESRILDEPLELSWVPSRAFGLPNVLLLEEQR